jgi:hypothetical protein
VGRWGPARREIYRQQVQYFCNHQHKMDYPRYLAQGWQIGSGRGCEFLRVGRLEWDSDGGGLWWDGVRFVF